MDLYSLKSRPRTATYSIPVDGSEIRRSPPEMYKTRRN